MKTRIELRLAKLMILYFIRMKVLIILRKQKRI